MSIYGKCTVCGQEDFNERIKGGDVCDDCRDYWLFGEERCDECNGHGSIYELDDCSLCDGKGYLKDKPGYLVAEEERKAAAEENA